MASVTLLEGQKVELTVTALDSAGVPTTVGVTEQPTFTVDVPNLIVIGPTKVATGSSWTHDVSLPSPPVSGTATITATLATFTATGTVVVSVTAGSVASITLTFGTPTPG